MNSLRPQNWEPAHFASSGFFLKKINDFSRIVVYFHDDDDDDDDDDDEI